MEGLALFLGLVKVEYNDKGPGGEQYILTRADSKTITLHTGTEDGRGFMAVDYGQRAKRRSGEISPRYAEIHPNG